MTRERDVLRANLDGAEYENLCVLLAEPEPRRSALARAVGTVVRARTLEFIKAKEQAERERDALREALEQYWKRIPPGLRIFLRPPSDIAALAPTKGNT